MALANFISTRILASTLFVVQPLYATNEDTPNSPPVSAKPLKMMSRLSGLIGKWQMQTIYSADQGQHWQDLGTVSVDIGYDQRKLMIYERPIQPNKTGFNMVSFITYDQYRNVFRKAAIDDVWGIMDLYKGEIKGDTLVLTNLDTGTLFPEPDGLLRGFRISLELEGDRRTMVIQSTLDKGKTWHPNFKNIYTRGN